jgi:hypothetical protein
MEASKLNLVPGYNPLTVVLIERLKSGQPGDVCTDKELTAMIGLDTSVGGNGYCYLQSAIKYVEKYFTAVWRRMIGQKKIMCLNPVEKIGLTQSTISQIGKKSRRTLCILNKVKQDEIPDDMRPTCNALAAQIGFIGAISSNKTTAKLIESNKSTAPQIGETLSMFK